jgi:hypothetical protein
MLVVENADQHHAGYGHDLEALIGTDGVHLKRVIGENDEAAERGSHWHHLEKGYFDVLVHVEIAAYDEADEGDHKVEEGESHVGKAVLDVNVLV